MSGADSWHYVVAVSELESDLFVISLWSVVAVLHVKVAETVVYLFLMMMMH